MIEKRSFNLIRSTEILLESVTYSIIVTATISTHPPARIILAGICVDHSVLQENFLLYFFRYKL